MKVQDIRMGNGLEVIIVTHLPLPNFYKTDVPGSNISIIQLIFTN
ncbi:hypothetical protein LYNGBM3L_47170 [Moorena producens 3L]|uniref:Uncharacterized protein n=1 Tax=Moorena producens 3L TaxID=489825 RepID=F4XXD2_9CYAN|nr:hypothetical protein LYNGBM3L_47170 [Moorena producens 3L]